MTLEERIASILAYDPETGEFTWKVTIHSHAVKGQKAGSQPARGAKRIQIDRKVLLCTRLAFLLHTGKWPDGVVILADKDDTNLRFNNLIDTTKSARMRRQDKPHKRTKSGLIGAHFHKKSGKWAARISWKTVKKKHIGLFDTPEEASAAYWARRNQLQQENDNERHTASD
ncbi:uncharacterized protein YeaC (DUF1315 family) [Peteryoungia aggregata LMG 23059]|uniref:Uncharacterized protein YeaC (DUF1315 family) n=1 Tax=Peteryoungia aggregata LMG 23059 TaxID=1368425 RepID=A0ABU0GAF5_9HYPH|nr:hypothetical protein [Peteryoungia aggregata]MDQ0422342.1 uncharacterized protein YeaC (DUF1315 family) [Peteryoungia aggregata LMG 23059]